MEDISLIISVVSAVISIVAIAVSVWIYFATVIHDRKEATLEAFNRLQSEVLDNINLLTKSQISELSRNTHSEKYKEVSSYLARIEHFCVGINTHIYDLNIVKRMAGKYFIGLYDKCLPMIEKKRNINKTDKHYNEFQSTVEKLEYKYKRNNKKCYN